LDGLSLVPSLDREELRSTLRGLLEDWWGILAGDPVLARQVMRKVVNGRLAFDEAGNFTGSVRLR